MSCTRTTDALIIAAGSGSRLAGQGVPKPLVSVNGTPLLERVVRQAAAAGIRRVLIVTGHEAAAIEHALATAPGLPPIEIRFVRNAEWQRPNGLSVRCAAAHLEGPFVLLMSDHLFDPAILTALLEQPLGDGEVILAVDSRTDRHPTVDLDDVTRVDVEAGTGLIRDIGKGLARYTAFDTGIFLCAPALFGALDESLARGDASLSGGMRVLASRGQARVMDIGARLWIDVDDERAYAQASALFAALE